MPYTGLALFATTELNQNHRQCQLLYVIQSQVLSQHPDIHNPRPINLLPLSGYINYLIDGFYKLTHHYYYVHNTLEIRVRIYLSVEYVISSIISCSSFRHKM